MKTVDAKEGRALSIRSQVMADAIKLTDSDRNKEYGEPHINLTLAGKIKALCRESQAREMSHGESEALDQVITKLARCFSSKKKEAHRDTYVDGACYFAIAYECAHWAEGYETK